MVGGEQKEKIEFDEDGEYYLIELGHENKEFQFIVSALFDEETYEYRELNVEFTDGFLADFNDESIARGLPDNLEELEGVEEIEWRDHESCIITYKEGQDLMDLLKRIEAKVVELSKK